MFNADQFIFSMLKYYGTEYIEVFEKMHKMSEWEIGAAVLASKALARQHEVLIRVLMEQGAGTINLCPFDAGYKCESEGRIECEDRACAHECWEKFSLQEDTVR